MEEGILYADDLDASSVRRLRTYARSKRAETIGGCPKLIRVYSRSKFIEQPPAMGHNGGPPPQDSDAGDLMIGVEPITEFVRKLTGDPDLPKSRVNHWLYTGIIPGRKHGSKWSASKSVLRNHWRTPTNMMGGDGPRHGG